MKCRLHKTSKNRKRTLRKSLLLCNSCAGLPCWESRFNFWEILGRLCSPVQLLRLASLQNRFGFFFFRLSGELSKKRASLMLRFTSRLHLLTCIKTPPKKLAPVLRQILKFHVVRMTSALCWSSSSWFNLVPRVLSYPPPWRERETQK